MSEFRILLRDLITVADKGLLTQALKFGLGGTFPANRQSLLSGRRQYNVSQGET